MTTEPLTSEDMFGLFAANANAMEDFARLASGQAPARSPEPLPPAPTKIEYDQPDLAEPKAPWWGLASLVPAVKRPRRRLARTAIEAAAYSTGT